MIQLFNPSDQQRTEPQHTTLLFDQELPNPAVQVSVIVPVRNEAGYLKQTLDALRLQQQPDGIPVPHATYEVLLLTNNCTDQSYEIARQYQTRFPEFALHLANVRLAPDKANIGHVRRLLMDEACRRLLLTGNRTGIIASTDGDTVVDRYWISQTMAEISRGNDAVGGRILTRTDTTPGGLTPLDGQSARETGCDELRRYHLLDVTYRHLIARVESILDPVVNDPWPRHFQHFGASLAVTCAAYLRAGRLPEVPYLEDEAFYRALLRVDATIRKSPLVKVFTSMRTQGRVAVGFSWQLSQWATMTTSRQLPQVEGAGALIARFRHRRQLRDCWLTMAHTDRRTDLLLLADALHLDPDWLCRETATSQYFGELYEKVMQQAATAPANQPLPPVPVTTAIRELRAYLSL